MLRSTHRIMTSHAGALEQPAELRPAIKARDEGQHYDEQAFQARLAAALVDVVKLQLDSGLDSICDGEFGKQNFTSYVGARISGYEPLPVDPAQSPPPAANLRRDRDAFPRYYERRGDTLYGRGTDLARTRLTCTGPLTYSGQAQLRNEIESFKQSLQGASYAEAFLPAAGPGILTSSTRNAYYPREEDFLWAIADAMHEEYRAIVDAGFLLQVDDPHLLMAWQHDADMSVGDYRKATEGRIEAINNALRGIPAESVRLHTCWGSWLGPHVGDVPLRDIADVLLKLNANGLSIEASNPRHEHEWQVWEDVKLPEGKVLMPGVVGHYSDFVEHPELIAARLVRYARLVGRENVIAGTDCGLRRVGHPEIAFAKFRAMTEGARLASQQLWG
jgi:5-methyltetrahydropteroyltriglutamate--homocysteine methyltransferase